MKDSRQTEASLDNVEEFTLAVGGEGKTREEVVSGKFGKGIKHFIISHPLGQIFEDVVHRDAKPSDARLAAPLAGLDGDDLAVVHTLRS